MNLEEEVDDENVEYVLERVDNAIEYCLQLLFCRLRTCRREELVTFSLGILLMVLSGLNTLSTRRDLIVFKFFPAAPSVPLKLAIFTEPNRNTE